MKRTNIYLTTMQKEKLKRIQEATGTQAAESTRRALDEYIDRYEAKNGRIQVTPTSDSAQLN